MDIEEHRPRGVAHVGDVYPTAGELPDDPAVHGSETKFSLFGPLASAFDVVEDPLDFRGREVGVEHQAGFCPNRFGPPLAFEELAVVGRAPILPHDGVVDGQRGLAIPYDGGFALVGDPDAGDVEPREVGFGNGFGGDGGLGVPDLAGVVLDPSGPRDVCNNSQVTLFKFVSTQSWVSTLFKNF